MANDNDPFGTNHPGALVILTISTLATFGLMAWLAKRNTEAHASLQEQLNALDTRLTAHEQDNTRHLPR